MSSPTTPAPPGGATTPGTRGTNPYLKWVFRAGIAIPVIAALWMVFFTGDSDKETPVGERSAQVTAIPAAAKAKTPTITVYVPATGTPESEWTEITMQRDSQIYYLETPGVSFLEQCLDVDSRKWKWSCRNSLKVRLVSTAEGRTISYWFVEL